MQQNTGSTGTCMIDYGVSLLYIKQSTHFLVCPTVSRLNYYTYIKLKYVRTPKFILTALGPTKYPVAILVSVCVSDFRRLHEYFLFYG